MHPETKRSTFNKETKPIVKHGQSNNKPQVNINKFAVLARALYIIKSDSKKYKGLLRHAQSQFNNYARELRATGKYTHEQLREVYNDAKTSDNPSIMRRATNQIDRYQFRRKAINLGVGVATTIAIGAIALTNMLGEKEDNTTEIINPPGQEQQYEQPQDDIANEFDFEVQPELSAKQFSEKYKAESKQQSENALWTIQFFEGTRKEGHQTVGRLDGLSFGKIQHNFAAVAQTGNDMLRDFFKKHPDSALTVFGATDLEKLKNLLEKSPAEIEQHMTDNYNYWQPIFKDKLLVHPDFIGLLDADAEKRMNQAHALCDRHQLTSALAFEFALNNNILAGHKGSYNNFAILDTIDRDALTPEIARAYLEQKFATRFANRDDIDQFMKAKRELINSLSDDALFDYYLLNIIEDQAPGPLQATRSKSILGLGGKWVNGQLQHGYDAYKNTWFAPDLAKLEQPRMPETEQGLTEALYNAGYSLDGSTQNQPAQQRDTRALENN